MDTKGRILVVTEEANARSALVHRFREQGYLVAETDDSFKALGQLREFAPELIVADLRMSGLDGMGLMRKAHEQDADIAVLVMGVPGERGQGVAALRAGARAHLVKPIDADEVSLVVERELERRRLRRETGQLRARLAERYRFENMIGSSAQMQAVFKAVSQVATASASVLLSGEAGTGKELMAAAIHEKSARAHGPFVKLHCASLAEALLDNELFGQEQGDVHAPTRRDGCLAQAEGGTLFLDEIDALSPALQIKLLRFLEDHTFQRVGGEQTVAADVRLIAASARNRHQMVGAGQLREDLIYRLAVINIELPALRERASDVPVLAIHFVHKYAAENGKAVSGFNDEALERLCGYGWPGNVRELENVIERAVLLCSGPQITGAELPPNVRSSKAGSAVQIPGSTLESIERYAITKTLKATEGSTGRAAEILGISIRKVQYKLHEYQGTARPERPERDLPAAPGKRN